ncbi:hypothetical protein B5G50_25005 [Brevibacillus brevis]|nr:hypothetical protein B5G50_25005 [Brevibacillus brevis]
MSDFDFPIFHISRGVFIEAEYQDPLLEDYQNNPLLEALPPIWDEKTVVQKLASKPLYKSSERNLPIHYGRIAYNEYRGTSSSPCRSISN